MRNLPFQLDKPLFAKIPLTSAGKQYKPGDHFDWYAKGVDEERVLIMYREGQVYHNEELEKDLKVIGDGLDSLNIEELHGLVETINKKVKKATKSDKEYQTKRCNKSTIIDKQRGHIRRWRSLYGHMENVE